MFIFDPFYLILTKKEWGLFAWSKISEITVLKNDLYGRSVDKTNQLFCLVCYLSFTTVLKPSVNFSKSKNAMSQKMPRQVPAPCKTKSLLRHPKAGFFLATLIEQWCLSNTFTQIKAFWWKEINNSVTAINNSTNPNRVNYSPFL